MNDKLKGYTERPNPAVWQDITHTMDRAKKLRRIAVWGGGTAACVVLVALFFVFRPEPVSQALVDGQHPMVDDQQLVAANQQPSASDPQPTVDIRPVAVEKEQQTQASIPVVNTPQPAPEKAAPVQQTATPAPANPAKATQSVDDHTPKSVTEQLPVATRPAAKKTDTKPVAPAPQQNAVAETPKVDNPPVTSPAGQTYTAEKEQDLWFPNIFSPSSDDDMARVFKPRRNPNGNEITHFKMAVYNRSGARVFYCTDLESGWDGTHQGRAMPQGAYVYVVFYTDADGMQHHLKGTVTLVR